MTGEKRGDTVRLRGAGVRPGIVRVTGNVNYLYFSVAVASMIFSTLAMAASSNAAGANGAGASKLPTKATTKKPEVACDTPDASKNSSASQDKTYNRNRSCLVSLSALDKLRTKKDFSLVDVRSPAEYDRYRIADSINIPLHLVKTKEFLKKLSVVLVNDGRSTTELEKKCGELKQAGFDHVSVLEGGLFAWYVNKRALEGDPAAQSKLNRMTAEELFEERTASNWSVIDVSTPGKSKDMRRWLPAKVTAIPIKSKGDSVARITSAISQQRKQNPQGRLLLIADDDVAYDRIDARLKKSGIAPSVLRLDGGLKAYREHVTKQLAIWDQQKQPRRYQACRS